MSAKANGNLISDLTMPNRILYSTNIVKGERKGKPKSYFRFDYAEPHPILAANAANIEKSSWRKKSSVSFFSFNTNSIILQKETLGSYTLSDTINRIRHDNC